MGVIELGRGGEGIVTSQTLVHEYRPMPRLKRVPWAFLFVHGFGRRVAVGVTCLYLTVDRLPTSDISATTTSFDD